MKDLQGRINKILSHYGLRPADFSRQLRINNNTTVSRIVAGKVNPSFEVLAKIARSFPEINANWLLTGDGEMLLGSIGENKTDGDIDHKKWLIEYFTRELEAKRKDCAELNKKYNELLDRITNVELLMLKHGPKKKEPGTDVQT
jgi:transcriptional regulator with XRE-family HTH domain